MWRIVEAGIMEFTLGQESWAAAACAAVECSRFALDVYEEIIADDDRSCYNCRYRRWTASSFTCQGPLAC